MGLPSSIGFFELLHIISIISKEKTLKFVYVYRLKSRMGNTQDHFAFVTDLGNFVTDLTATDFGLDFNATFSRGLQPMYKSHGIIRFS